MKKILSYLFIICLFISCTEDNLPEVNAYGQLEILPIEITTETDTEIIKRGVDSQLQIDILQSSTIIRTYEAGSTELNEKISLPVGDYTIIAHTPNMQEAANNIQGTPTYSVSKEFQIAANATTTIDNLTATQANIGISLDYQDELLTSAFTSVVCTLYSPSTGRTVDITGTDNKNLTYFNVPDNGILQYSFKATNTDGETFTSDTRTIEITTAKNYTIQVQIE